MSASTWTFRDRNEIHLIRKLWHIFTGMTVLFFYYQNLTVFPLKKWFGILFILGVLGFLIEYVRLNNVKINDFICKIFGKFMRNEELQKFSGLPYYALGCAFSIYLFPQHLSLLSIYFLIFADPFSSLFGIKFGKRKIYKDKSWVGFLAGCFICFFITLVYGFLYDQFSTSYFFFALSAGLIGGLSELFAVVDDNLTIPIISGLGLTLLNSFPMFGFFQY